MDIGTSRVEAAAALSVSPVTPRAVALEPVPARQRAYTFRMSDLFVLAADVETDAEHFLAEELSRSIRRPDLAVIVGEQQGIAA